MWRALFLAVGITLCIVGAECLVIEKATFAGERPVAGAVAKAAQKKDIVPPDWAPWSLLSAGAVVIIYSFTIPKRMA